jgi:hypothetical protein
MFEQAIQASEAMRAQNQGTLIPALSGCRACGTMHMIAAPVLGVCEDCGGELTVPSGAELRAPDISRATA